MSEKVSITKSKLDSLANAIASVGETSVPKTITQMENAVLELSVPSILQNKTITPSVNQQIITPDVGYDGFSSVTVNAIELQEKTVTPTTEQQIVIPDSIEYTYEISEGLQQAGTGTSTMYFTENKIQQSKYFIVGTSYKTEGEVTLSTGTVITFGYTDVATSSQSGATTTSSLQPTYDYTGPTEISSLVVSKIGNSYVYLTIEYTGVSEAPTGIITKKVQVYEDGQTIYDGLSKVTVNAMPSGTAGTPTATKGTVSNHSISVTPSVTNTTGYITGSTISGTAVTVDVTELESGTKSITTNGTGISVSGYSTVDVNVSGGGGGDNGNLWDSIRFFDYDGTLVASYTSVPSALPSLPSHSKLKNGVWNYTLQQITSLFNEIGQCDIGANYETVSGKTEIDICLTDSSRLSPRLCISVNGTVVVDWGDGGSTTTLTGSNLTSARFASHDYSTTGEYTISIEVQSGSFAFYGGTTAGTYCFLCTQTSTNYDPSRPYMGAVKELRVGPNCSFGKYACYPASFLAVSLPPTLFSFAEGAFYSCDQLKALIIPYGTTITTRLIQGCTGLRVVVIPTSVTAIGSYFCMNSRLMRVCIPNTVTAINDNSFNAMKYISSFKIPSSVSIIGSKAFSNQTGILEYHFYNSIPPTLNATDVFTSSLSTGRVIYVPTASVDTYKGDTNWSTYASYIQGE